jgi:hypothetical protein
MCGRVVTRKFKYFEQNRFSKEWSVGKLKEEPLNKKKLYARESTVRDS